MKIDYTKRSEWNQDRLDVIENKDIRVCDWAKRLMDRFPEEFIFTVSES